MFKNRFHEETRPGPPEDQPAPDEGKRCGKWDILRDGIKGNSFIFSCVVVGVALLAILWTQPLKYDANDDFAMITILSGKGGFPSSPHAIFLNPVLSYVFNNLYGNFPSFPWYGMALYALFFLGWSLVISVITRSNRGFCYLAAVPLLAYLFYYHATAITFTSASLLLSTGVYLCVFEYFVADRVPVKSIKAYFIFLVSCFCLSFLFRWDLVLYSLLFLSPVVVFMKFSRMKEVLPIIVVTGLLVCANIAFNHHVSSSHQPYNEFNKLRGEFHDTSRGFDHGQVTRGAASGAGWTYEDYMTFRLLWMIYDNYAFNTEKLRTFLAGNDFPENGGSFLSDVTARLKMSYEQNENVSILLLLSVLSLFLVRLVDLVRLDGIDWLKMTACLGAAAAGIIFLMHFRFIIRVFGPLYLFLFGLSFLLFNRAPGKGAGAAGNNFQKCLAVMAGIISVYSLTIVKQETEKHSQFLHRSRAAIEYVSQSLKSAIDNSPSPGPLMIEMCPSYLGICTDLVNPLKEHAAIGNVKLFPGGWLTNSPYYENVLRSLDVHDGHELLKWIVNRKDVLLVLYPANVEDVKLVVHLWRAYYLRHIFPYRPLRFVPVYDFRNEYGAGLIFFRILT